MHHKRKRPKHQRAGCLQCKPQKDERGPKAASARPSVRRHLQTQEEETGEAISPHAMTAGEQELADLLWRRVELAASRLRIPLRATDDEPRLARWFERLGVLTPEEAAFLLKMTPSEEDSELSR
jgi:hypothetical protein